MHKQFADTAGYGAEAAVSGAQEEAFTVLAGRIAPGLLLLCDHASNAFPPGYDTLGLPPAQLERHIAYDIGALGVVQRLSAAMGVPAVHTHYSRLLIDPNRGVDDPTLIMRLSDGAVVPGNRVIDADERERRLSRYYRPYHAAIDGVINTFLAAGVPPVIVSVHSFTDNWKGSLRPWHVSILWGRDPRFAVPLMEALSAEGNLIVGDNEPYLGELEGDCMWQHGVVRGLPHAIIELRQDLIADERGQTAWADRLSRVLSGLIARDDLKAGLRKVQHFYEQGERDDN